MSEIFATLDQQLHRFDAVELAAFALAIVAVIAILLAALSLPIASIWQR